MNRLKDKVACITGAGSGIGRATALRFASEGARVMVTDLRGDAAQVVVAEIAQQGGTAHAMGVDVGREDQLAAMIDATVSRFGRIDILYNNAVNTSGKGKADKDFLAFDSERFFDVVRVNVLGGVLASRMAIPHLHRPARSAVTWRSSATAPPRRW